MCLIIIFKYTPVQYAYFNCDLSALAFFNNANDYKKPEENNVTLKYVEFHMNEQSVDSYCNKECDSFSYYEEEDCVSYDNEEIEYEIHSDVESKEYEEEEDHFYYENEEEEDFYYYYNEDEN